MAISQPSDGVLIALFTMVGAIISASLSAVTAYLTHRNGVMVTAQKTSLEKLTTNTDGMKDALVKITGESQKAIGNLEGRAELTAETNATTVNKGLHD